MIDIATRERVRIQQYPSRSTGKAYIHLSEQQINTVTAVLNDNKISYTIDDYAISKEGGPHMTYINIISDTAPAVVQKLLDRDKTKLPPICVEIDGKQISEGRLGVIERYVELLKSKNPEIDLNLCKIVMTIVPVE